MRLEPLGDRDGVLNVTFDAEAERFDSLNQCPRVVRCNSCADVAKQLHARFDDVRDSVTENGGVRRSVVGGVRFGESGELLDVLRPRELSAVDDRTGHDCSVTTEELRRRVNDDVRAVFKRTDEVRRRNRVVDEERDAGFVSNSGHALDVENVDAGVGDGLAKERLRVGANRVPPLVEVVLVLNERHVDAKLR